MKNINFFSQVELECGDHHVQGISNSMCFRIITAAVLQIRAGVSGHGIGSLVMINRKMNAQTYVEILNTVLLGDLDGRFPEGDVYNVEDNSPVHTAHVVREWYALHPRFHRLPHPPRSPDLNVIENVWAKMVENWRPNLARTQEALQERILQSWLAMENEPRYCRTLTSSMTRRLQSVINCRGGYVNY